MIKSNNRPIWLEQAIEMRRSFIKNSDIAEALSLSEGRVYKALKSFMDEKEYKETRQSNKPNPRDNQMIKMYQEGKTLEEIGNYFDLSRERVRQILDKEGVEAGLAQKIRRKQKEEKLNSTRSIVLDLLLKGQSYEFILSETKLNRSEFLEVKNYLIKEKSIPKGFRAGQAESYNLDMEIRREEVLKYRSEGKNNKEIAILLDVSEATVLRDARTLRLRGIEVPNSRSHWNEGFLAFKREGLYEDIKKLRKEGNSFNDISKILDQPLRKIMDRVSELRAMGEIL